MIQTQLIYCGDNIQKLKEIPDESVDRFLSRANLREREGSLVPTPDSHHVVGAVRFRLLSPDI